MSRHAAEPDEPWPGDAPWTDRQLAYVGDSALRTRRHNEAKRAAKRPKPAPATVPAAPEED